MKSSLFVFKLLYCIIIQHVNSIHLKPGVAVTPAKSSSSKYEISTDDDKNTSLLTDSSSDNSVAIVEKNCCPICMYDYDNPNDLGFIWSFPLITKKVISYFNRI